MNELYLGEPNAPIQLANEPTSSNPAMLPVNEAIKEPEEQHKVNHL